MTTGDGTIDVTELVEKTRATWTDWAAASLYGAAIAIPYLSWLGWPGVSKIFYGVLLWAGNQLSTTGVMAAFFLNTAIRKASQAEDFLDALKAKESLPGNASDDDYEKAEEAQMEAFRRFVRVSN